jgi:hypothetical protein
MIRHRPADWVMRHLVGEATPELELLRESAALYGSSIRANIRSERFGYSQADRVSHAP